MNENPEARRRAGSLARGALALAALWIAAGALFKLLAGSPNDLPPIVRETLALDLGLKYRLAIGAELAIAVAALLRPGLGWGLVALLLVAFDVVLAFSLDQETCGCFGSTVPITPVQMMAIDSALLLAVLAGRPWRGFRGPQAPWAVVAGAMLVALVVPWLHDRQVRDDAPQLSPSDDTDVAANGGGAEAAQGTSLGRDWIELPVERWEGELIHDTALARFVDPNTLPADGMYVLWRWTCDHCAEHLQQLADEDTGERMLTLLRLEEPTDTEANRAVFVKPSGPHVVEATLPATVDYVVTTPAELEVEGYVVLRGEEGVDDH